MSGIIGKKNSTLKKESVKESKLLETGVRNLKFWHEASEGDKSIPFGSLVTPESILAGGLSNPTSTAILAANLGFFKENVEVRSSLNGDLMIGLTYVVSNSQIKFVNGYEAVEGEVFEVKVENNVVTGNTIVDARPLTATGILATGNTDFNVGESFKTNANPNTQLGDVLVFMDGVLQFRNVANATAAPLADGNYQEIHAANGSGVIIRFNDSFAVDRNIIVTSRNLIAERPNLSMLQAIEGFGGQLDKVIETTAALAGVPETDFQAAPNQVDLKAFGDKVIALERIFEVEIPSTFEEVITYVGFISKNGNTEVKLLTKTDDTSDVLVSVDNTGDHTRYTFLQECNFSSSASAEGGGANGSVGVSHYDSDDVLLKRTVGGVGPSGQAASGLVGRVQAGDYLLMRAETITPANNVRVNFSVKATKRTVTKIKDLI